MELRIKFSAEVVITGKNINEIRQKWESMPLFSEEADEKYGAEFCEVLLVDDEDYNDLTSEFEYGEDDKESKGMSLEEYIDYLYGIYNSAGDDKDYVDLYVITRGNTERLDGKYLHYGVLDESLVDDIVLTLRDKINGNC